MGNRFRASLSVVTPFYIAGRPEARAPIPAVQHPYGGPQIGETGLATEDQVERAVAAAKAATKEVGARPAAARAAALDHVSARLKERADEVVVLNGIAF